MCVVDSDPAIAHADDISTRRDTAEIGTQVDDQPETPLSPLGRDSPRPDALIMVEKSMLKRLSSHVEEYKVVLLIHINLYEGRDCQSCIDPFLVSKKH